MVGRYPRPVPEQWRAESERLRMRVIARGWPGRLAGVLAVSALAVTACASGAGAPGPPSAYLGTVVDTPVPASVANLPLTTDTGQVTSLAAWHGQVVVLTDWLTGRTLGYDIDHEDALVYLDARGRERFLVVGNPNARAAPIAPALRRFLSAQGRVDLSHPDASTWTAAEALSPIAWLTGEMIRLPAN